MTLVRPSDDALLEMAGAWHVRLADPQSDQIGLEDWLSADPRHRQAFDQVGQGWAMLDATAEPGLDPALRKDILDRAHAHRRSRVRGILAALTAIAAALVLAIFAWPMLDGSNVYRTEPGEGRSLVLADGSRLTLDGASAVRVAYSDGQRELWLERGQARFEVAHDTTRPFRVHARDRIVTATGTAFDIELLEPKTVVTLIEGSVRVTRKSPGRLTGAHEPTAAALKMKAGERLVIDAATPPRLAAVDIPGAMAWEDGRLIFNDEPLPQAVERINRHTRRQIILVDPAARSLRVSGVFKTREADGFGRVIAEYLPVRIARETETQIMLAGK